MGNIKKRMKRNIIKDFIILLLAYLLFRYALLLGLEMSDSMSPTLRTSDVLISNRLAYVFSEPERGDIISFDFLRDGERVTYCKRVIGIAGDEVSFADGKVIVNDEVIDESEYLPEGTYTIALQSYVVPENCCFVLGDNRWQSYDSRYWEEPYVRYEDIKARLMFRIPFSKLKKDSSDFEVED